MKFRPGWERPSSIGFHVHAGYERGRTCQNGNRLQRTSVALGHFFIDFTEDAVSQVQGYGGALLMVDPQEKPVKATMMTTTSVVMLM